MIPLYGGSHSRSAAKDESTPSAPMTGSFLKAPSSLAQCLLDLRQLSLLSSTWHRRRSTAVHAVQGEHQSGLSQKQTMPSRPFALRWRTIDVYPHATSFLPVPLIRPSDVPWDAPRRTHRLPRACISALPCICRAQHFIFFSFGVCARQQSPVGEDHSGATPRLSRQ